MKCTNCGVQNATDAKFCENCGQPFDRACPNCGKPNSPAAKFCKNCGFNLAAAPDTGATARLENLQRAAPTNVQEKVLAARKQIEGERKLVTVLFTDIVGSTTLAESMDPEEWGEIVAGAHERVSAAIYRYEGTIAQLLGDGVLAFFGAPITHEDDPVRAVNAALDIQSSIQEYARELGAKNKVKNFQMRVGLNTGLVVVGNIGSDLHMEYLAVGDTVNLAARMQSAAEPGTALITQGTQRLVRHAFELESRGELEVKGKAEKVPAFRVSARKAAPESARGIEGLSSPLVGRERETELLQNKLQDLLRGSGQIVAVMGDAGLGKSRLIAEIRKWTVDSNVIASEAKQSPSNTGIASAQSMRLAMTSGDVLWLEGRSLSYDTAIPYAPFKDLFTRFFDLRAEEFDDEKYAKIYARVQETMGARADEIAPFIGAMLGLELKGDAAERTRYLEPPQLRGAVFGALAQFIGTLAQKPIVVMFEDLHWADSTSLDLIDQLLKLTESAPLMILALFRPQRQEPSWRFHENAQRDYAHRYTAIQLEPLDEKHSRQLVANLLEIEDLPEKVRALILKKAEGNPFFVEEVIRSLLDAKLVVRSNGHWRATREIENVAVPDTLQGVITARLDRLDEQSKKIAQTAAVIGREFAFQVLEQIAEARQGLNDSVVNLQRRELVREKSRVPELLYLFKHALTQETAYASVLLSKRRELHKKVADCLERVAPDRVNDIARHYLEAQDETRALPYLVEAGEKAAHAYSNPEAIQYLSRALEILQKADDKALARRAYEALGGTLMLTMQVEPALKHYHAMIEYGKAHNEMGMQVAAHNKLGRIFGMFMGQLEEGEKHLAEAERLGRDCNDGAGLSELYTIRCGVSTMQADFSNATHYLSESVNFGRQTNLSEPVAFGLTHTANTFTYMCRFDDAYEKGKEALQVSESIGNQLHISEIYAFVNPYYYAHLGDLERARIDAEKGSEIALRIGDGLDAAVGLYFLGMIARWRGEYENAIEFFNRTLQAAQMSSFPVHALPVAALGATLLEVSENLAAKANPLLQQGMEMLNNPFMAASGSSAWADLGFSFLALGKLDEAFANFQKGANYPGFMILLNKPRNLGGSALVALARKNFEDANKLIAEARAFAEEHAMKFEYPFLTIVDGMIRAARGDQSGALEKFTHAENLAQEMGMRVALLQARIATARVLAQMGKKTQADAKRKDARAMVDEIARLFKDEEMKRAFVESAGKRLTDDNRR